MISTGCTRFTEVMTTKIFSEIYGAYFRIVSRLLTEHALTDNEVYSIIAEDGFRDTNLFLTKKLLPQNDGSDWGLLRRDKAGVLHPVTISEPPHILTTLQKCWLRSKLDDPRLCLFLDDRELNKLCERVADVPPLYPRDTFRYVDRYSDGDPFTDPDYRSNFRAVLSALKNKQLTEISYISRTGKNIVGKFLPYKLEYSHRDDKFRVFCTSSLKGTAVINLARIVSAEPAKGRQAPQPPDESTLRCTAPIELTVSSERSADERFLMEFAAYEKRTERIEGSDKVSVKLWYDKQDETDLLVRLLGFGPVLEITAPPEIRRQAAERVRKQWHLLHSDNE